MAAQPLHEGLLVRRIEDKGIPSGKTRLPGTAKRKPWKGEVLAVADEEDRGGPKVVPDVKVGDKVLFGEGSAIEVKISGEDLLILPRDEFLVVIR